MSLVYEALQKAEREKQRKTGVVPPVPAPVPAPTIKPTAVEKPPPAKSHQGLLIAAILSVSIVAIVAIVFIVSRMVAQPREDKPVVEKAPPSEPITAAARPEPRPPEPLTAVVAPVAETPRLKLTGIAPLPDGKFCAFFANRPLPAYEQQEIEGVTIKKIEQDRVTLLINGKEKVLRLF